MGPNEPLVEDISDLPGNDLQNKRHRSRRRAWRDGLLTKPSFRVSKMFGPTERSSAPSSPVLFLDQ